MAKNTKLLFFLLIQFILYIRRVHIISFLIQCRGKLKMSEFKAYFTLNFAVCLYIELGFSLRLMYSLSSINFVSIKKYLMVLVNKQGFSPFFFTLILTITLLHPMVQYQYCESTPFPTSTERVEPIIPPCMMAYHWWCCAGTELIIFL